MKGLAGGAEGDELLDATRTGLRSLGVLQPPEDRLELICEPPLRALALNSCTT
jgi:hypothetical protein